MSTTSTLEGYTLEELLEITLAKARHEPIKNQPSLQELLQRVNLLMREQLAVRESGSFFPPRLRSYSLMHSGGKTMHSEALEELLNIDRMLSGLPPLLFADRAPSTLPYFQKREEL